MTGPDPVDAALARWGMTGAACSFVAGRENRVYRVEDASGVFALRLRRPGYRSAAELRSELDWMAAMARAGLRVPSPRASRSGALIEDLGGQSVDMITWLDGAPLGQTGSPLHLADPVRTFARLGAEMARLHHACDAWTPPAGFTRCAWDAQGLVGDAPLWGRFWDNPTLDAPTRSLLTTFRDRAARALAGGAWDTGLIHADLVRENVLIDGQDLALIDFDDGGFGYRLFDIATALLKNRAEPRYDALKSALLRGYLALRPLDLRALDLFMALRAATYVGWIVPRLTETGAEARNARLVRDARDLCGAWMDSAG